MAARSNNSPIPGLKVSLQQTSSTASPVTVVAIVTNTNDHSVTVLDYDSPLDSLALQLGLLKLTPDGASNPLDLPTIQLRRVWPPSRDSLITIAAGDTVRNEIPLKEPVVKLDELKGKYSVRLEGSWQAVWSSEKAAISESALENAQGSQDVFRGQFASEALEMQRS